MVSGIELAKEHGDKETAVAIDAMKDQLIIALMKRLVNSENKLIIPIAEVDDTGCEMLSMELDRPNFIFEIVLKS